MVPSLQGSRSIDQTTLSTEMSLLAGLDEAGRGSVIGPLVVSGVLTDQTGIKELRRIGVKDSKLLSAKKREKLAEEIKNIVLQYASIELSPVQIDKAVASGVKYRRLNYLELEAMAEIAQMLRPSYLFIDPCDVSPQRCVNEICAKLLFHVDVICEFHADRTYPLVGAASIIAKVQRDKTISELRGTFGDFGSGYPSDKKTVLYLENSLRQNGELPQIVRSSWLTVKRLRATIQFLQQT